MSTKKVVKTQSTKKTRIPPVSKPEQSVSPFKIDEQLQQEFSETEEMMNMIRYCDTEDMLDLNRVQELLDAIEDKEIEENQRLEDELENEDQLDDLEEQDEIDYQ